MRIPYVKISRERAREEIARLKASHELMSEFKVKREGDWVLIPVKHSGETGEFEERISKKMTHVGSFDRISDFYVIREREGWENVLEEIVDKQRPRAVFLDRGVEGPYRIRKLERIFGSGKPTGVHRENGLRYLIDLEKAYFSPRLGGIRRHIVEKCVEHEKRGFVVDMYAGVGPISIPLAKRGMRILAIDINPGAVELLSRNMKLNKVKGEILLANSNLIVKCFRRADQVIMNNPAQSLSSSFDVISTFKRGTIIHFTSILGKEEELSFRGIETLEERTVHGYSPSSSIVYYRLVKR